jgi:ABC-type multidrug transport system fused ATPase/permease subunit
VDNEPQRPDAAFRKACSYLNFNAPAKWAAHVAGVGTGVVAVLLLTVGWLFVDLMIWRGRIPEYRDLPLRQQGIFRDYYNGLHVEERYQMLEEAGISPAQANALAVVEKNAFDELGQREVRLVWRQYVWEVLQRRVGRLAADQVFPPEKQFEMDRRDHGVLSLVVREEARGRWWSPVFLLARYNSWMWNTRPESRSFLLPPFLAGLTLTAAILGLVFVILAVLNRDMAARAVIEATTRLRRAVYHHTFRLGTLAVRALGPSEAVSILTRHIEAVHDALYALLTAWYREPIQLALLLALAILIDPLLALAFILFAVIVWLLGVRIVAYFRQQSKLATHVAAERLTIIRESLMLMRLVKVYVMEQFNQARIERQLSRYAHVQRIRHRAEALARPVLVLLGGACALILLYVAALLVLYGELSAAGAVVLCATLLSLYRPLERWLAGRRLIRRGRDAAEQVFSFLERRGEVGQVVGAEFLPPLSRQIEFDNVSLRDPGTGRMLLEGISITIPAGQRIGLCGADELEKHALVYLIPRLLDPTAGEIRIDQHNLRWVTLDSLRAQIGIVMMHNLVFHDTIRNNIGCGDHAYTLPQIIEASKMAHAHHFIQKLPQGYETPIGELGHQLSTSEQYRIALARAILRDPALLIIEEPDTELDEETKNLLDDTLVRTLPGRTAIFLPHRISTLRSCNTIFLFNKGRVVASGSHKELLGTSKLYRHLYYLEFNQMEEAG